MIARSRGQKGRLGQRQPWRTSGSCRASRTTHARERQADVPGAVPGVPVFKDKAAEFAELLRMMAEHQQGQQQQQLEHSSKEPGSSASSSSSAPSSSSALSSSAHSSSEHSSLLHQQQRLLLQGLTEVLVLCIPLATLWRRSMMAGSWSLFSSRMYTHVDSFCANKAALTWQREAPRNPLVPSAVYELPDSNWLDLEVIREITGAIKIFPLELEGEQYITGSRVIPLLEGVRARLDSTRMHFGSNTSP